MDCCKAACFLHGLYILHCIENFPCLQWSVKQLCICFEGNGVGERKRKFVHHSLVFFNHCLHACQPACVCVFLFFWSNHVWCLRPSDPCCLFRKHETGLELNQPFVWPHKTSLPAWQSTEHRLSPIEKLRVSEAGSRCCWRGEVAGFSCIADFWQTINQIAKTAKRKGDYLKGNSKRNSLNTLLAFSFQTSTETLLEKRRRKKLKAVNRKQGTWSWEVQMRFTTAITWCGFPLDAFAFGCTAGQDHTITEELLQQDTMLLWGLFYHALHHEYQWTSAPGQPGQLHSG